jgi:hypothetical protein
MAGTVVANVLNTDTGLFSTNNAYNGIAKAWVQFAGSTGTIAGSFNVSSITRASTGTYTINYTTAMLNANYAVSFGCGNASGGVGVPRAQAIGNITTTQLQFINAQSTSGTLLDDTITSAVVFGS